MEAAGQPRLTIGKFCPAPVALRAPHDPLRPGGEDLTLILCPHKPRACKPPAVGTQQGSAHSSCQDPRAQGGQSAHPQSSPASPLQSSPLECQEGLPCHKNEPFLLFFLVSLKINKEQALQNHKLNTMSAAPPWKVCLG